MRRDYGNEILVAIGAVSVIVFALAFAVILIVSNQSASPTATPSVTVGPILSVLQATTEARASATHSAASATQPLIAIAASMAQTATTLEPATAVPRVSETQLPATNTVRPSATPVSPTNTPRPSATVVAPTNTPRPTVTPVPSTNTPRPTATSVPSTNAPRPTATSVPATNTPRPTVTPVPPTPTPRPTVTPVPPTNTPRPTATPTFTPFPTIADAGILPTPTLVPTATAVVAVPSATLTTAEATSTHIAGCPPPPGWVAYRVQLGDTLFSIAQRVGSSVAELRTVNCIADADTIFAEQVIYVPGTPGAPSVRAEGCSARGVIITVPEMGALVSGVVEVRGTANIDNFSFYRLEIRAATANAYTTVMTGRTPVNDGVLGEIDFADYGVGLFYVRLVVVNQRGTFPQPCAIPVLAR